MKKKTEEQIHYNMSRIKGRDTSIKIKLRKALYHNGIRYRKNDKRLPGHPDIVISKYRIAIFCDGDFFHGYDMSEIESHLKTNTDYWKEKIVGNRNRDVEIDQKLVKQGYHVLHFWEHEINQDLNKVLNEIYLTIEEIRISGQ